MERILTETMAPIRADIQVMKDDNQVMKDDIQIMKDDIQIMKNDIQVMKDDIRDVKRVQGQVWKLAARVSCFFPWSLPYWPIPRTITCLPVQVIIPGLKSFRSQMDKTQQKIQ